MSNGLPRSYDAWRSAGPPEPRDDLPPGYEEIDGLDEAISCAICMERVDYSRCAAVKMGTGPKTPFFCSPECAWEDHRDREICAAEMRAEERRDR